LVQYITAASLYKGNHDRNPWFSILLQQSSFKEIMIETLVQYLTAAILVQGNHDRNPWFSTLLQHPSIKEIMIETLGSVPYCSIPRSGIS
jgi:hypothetical protein